MVKLTDEKFIKQFSSKLPKELVERVNAKAKKEGKTMTGIIAEFFNDYVKEGDLQEQINELRKRLDNLEKEVQRIKK